MRHLSLALLISTLFVASPALSQTPSVTVYENCEFTGKSATFGSGNYRITDIQRKGIMNDAISSIKVGKGAQVRIFKHDEYSGNTLMITSDRRCLKGTGLNNDISSMRVQPLSKPQAPPRRTGNTDRQRVINFQGGRFELTDTKVWTEYNSYGRSVATYEQLSNKRGRLFLYDPRTEDLIEIDRQRGTVRMGPFGEDNPVRYTLERERKQGGNYSTDTSAFDPANYTESGVTAVNVQAIKFRDKSTQGEGYLRHQGTLGGGWIYENSTGRRLDLCQEMSRRSSIITLKCKTVGGQLVMDLFWDRISLDRNGRKDEVANIIKAYRLR